MEKSNLVPFLRVGLDILFVGLNPAKGSSMNRHYFSVNQAFWNQLFKSGLITVRVDKSRADEVVFGSTRINFQSWSYGVTDLVTSVAESDSTKIKPTIQDRQALLSSIKYYSPTTVILLHGKVLSTFLPFIRQPVPDANAGVLGQLVKDCPATFVSIAFPHGNAISSSAKVARYIEVKDFLLTLKRTRMATITRRRTLRPSSREVTSTYKVDTKKVTAKDTLRIEIYSEDKPGELIALFELSGQAVASKNSIHFDATAISNGWSFEWSGAQPKRIS